LLKESEHSPAEGMQGRMHVDLGERVYRKLVPLPPETAQSMNPRKKHLQIP
jgi:hypothetical protein